MRVYIWVYCAILVCGIHASHDTLIWHGSVVALQESQLGPDGPCASVLQAKYHRVQHQAHLIHNTNIFTDLHIYLYTPVCRLRDLCPFSDSLLKAKGWKHAVWLDRPLGPENLISDLRESNRISRAQHKRTELNGMVICSVSTLIWLVDWMASW